MGLKVWLPLNGNLRNQGTSDLQFSNNDTTTITLNNNGKIGQCYTRSAIKTAGRIISNNKILLDNDLSMCCWAKVTTAVGDTANGLITNHSHNNNTGFGITVKQVSDSDYRVSCNTGNGNSRTYCTYYGTTNIKDNWHHLALTYNNTIHQFQLWVDGNLEVTQNYTNAAQADNIILFDWSTTYNSTNYRPACSLNDVRIYDHCLSAAEVKEISQGLVSHYKLNDIKVKIGTNLVTGITAGAHVTKLTDGRIGVQTTGENADTYFTINLSENITNGTKYFLSCNASGISEGSYWNFPLGTQSNSTLSFKIYNGYNRYVFTANDINWGTNRLFMDDSTRPDWANKATFWNFELYKEPTLKIEDSSGYGHDGTIVGTLSNVSNTQRYDFSTFFNGTSYINIPKIFNDNVLLPEFTCACWVKRNYTDLNEHAIYCGIAYIRFRTYEDKNFVPFISWTHSTETTSKGNSWTTNSPLLENTWTHIAYTFKDGNLVFYCNGQEKGTSNRNNTGQYIKTNYGTTIGQYNNTNFWNGSMSDMRIYTTALDATAIKQLYEVGAKIDNKQNLHSYEFKELKNNLMFGAELNRTQKKYGNGLQSYTQTNCQVTLTDQGIRIYRPPNIMNGNNGGSNNMWGGLKLRNSTVNSIHEYNSTTDNIFNLQKGHTYLWLFHVKGTSSNASVTFYPTNRMDWSGGGLNASPSNVQYSGIPENFNGEKDCYYYFTINDEVVKTCTTSYSDFIAGRQYMSYYDFSFGWQYTNTGSMGTDIYITDIQLYDITNCTGQIKKNGILNFSAFFENNRNASINKGKIFNIQELIEF